MSNTTTWTATCKEYAFTKVTLTVKGENLTIRLNGRYVKPYTTVVENFKEHTACELFLEFDFGPHFEEAVWKMYKDLGLDVGCHQKILRSI